jgi:uncharacterized protein
MDSNRIPRPRRTGGVFADSSALVKLYSNEEGNTLVRQLPLLVVSQLARVEVPAAIWRKCRSGHIDAREAAVLAAQFEADYFGSDQGPPRFLVIALVPELLTSAARLAAVHRLRGYDAVQLSAACAFATIGPECRAIAAFDADLRRAAAAEGLDLIPQER